MKSRNMMIVKNFLGSGCVKLLTVLSDFIIPIIIFYIVGFAALMKRPVYDDFVKGAKKGAKTVVEIMPTLVGLMVAVGVLRASGFLDALAGWLGKATDRFGFPSQLLPVAIVKMFSSSAATGLALDVFRQYGTDSRLGLITSLMLSCTETIFYTMSIYFVTARVTKTRYTLAGAMFTTIAGIGASVVLAGMMM